VRLCRIPSFSHGKLTDLRVRKQFETSAEQTQHLMTLAQKVTTEAAQPLSGVVGARTARAGIVSSPNSLVYRGEFVASFEPYFSKRHVRVRVLPPQPDSDVSVSHVPAEKIEA
jgi:hypothetical protein